MSSFFVSGLSIMCSWNTYPVSMRALGDVCELDLSGSANRFGGGKRILVTHVGPTGTGRTRVWEVWTQKRATAVAQQRTHRAAVGGLEGLRLSAAQLKHELASSAGSLASPSLSVSMPEGLHQAQGSSVYAEEDKTDELDPAAGGSENQGKYRVYDSLHPDLYISVSELYCLNHDKYEISCCTMSTSASIATSSTATGSISDRAVDKKKRRGLSSAGTEERELPEETSARHNALDAFRQSTLVYMGTSSGMIFRFSFRK